MTRNEVLDFIKTNTSGYMATLENGEPCVRAMDTPVVDENGLTFCTGTVKSVCRQLIANPAVELCYWSTERRMQVRLRGRMEKLDDEALKKSIVETRFVFLKPVVEAYGWDALSLFRLSHGKASIWKADNPAGNSETFEF